MSVRSNAPELASMTLLAAWVGAVVFVAAVIAPAAFAVLPTRALAGAVVGRALPVLFGAGILIGVAVALVGFTGQMPATRWATAGAVCLAGASAAALLVAMRLQTMRVALGAPIDTLHPADPRRVDFGRLHGVSVLLMGLGLLAACVALVAIARQVSARAPA